MERIVKALFLDIDAVLNSIAFDRTRTPEQGNIDPSRLPLVKQIIEETHCVIVLSSSWRKKLDDNMNPIDETGRQLLDLFSNAGLTVYDKTPVLSSNDRAEEIRMWLREHPEIQAFVILDDMAFGWTTDLQEHLVRTDARIGRGLEDRHVKRTVELLNGWARK